MTTIKRQCRYPGCRSLVSGKRGFCDAHRKITGWNDPNRGSAASRGYDSEWTKLAKAIKERDGYLCQECLRRGRIVQCYCVDHITPKFEDGTDDPCNLESLCEECHDAKTKEESKRARLLHG